MNLILFGCKGCGKTHWGRWLAGELKMPFIDTDERLSQSQSLPLRQLYLSFGEKEFRRLETEVIGRLQTTRASVIALGGGAMAEAVNRELLSTLGPWIFLDVPFETIVSRGVDFPGRSLVEVDRERRELYASLPAHSVRGSDAEMRVQLTQIARQYGF